MINILLTIRSQINRFLYPAVNYKLAPISSKFGFDRGKPIDRYWIEKFLKTNQKYIKGKCLEITNSAYTRQFGGTKVTVSDVLDIDPENKQANIIADLRDLKAIPTGSYDCIILTHVLGLIDNCQLAVSECHRVLKPDGVILFTSSCLGPVLGEQIYWRFTANSIQYLFSKYFKSPNLSIHTYGNALCAQAFLVGMSQEDLPPNALDQDDPRFPCIVTAVAKKS